jgi:hypothetical protein
VKRRAQLTLGLDAQSHGATRRYKSDRDVAACRGKSRFLATLAGFTGSERLGMTRLGDGVLLEGGIELIQEFGVVFQSALQDFCLSFGRRPVLGFDCFG